jgi:hypothetical protein
MNDFIYALGEFFQATFTILPKLGNLPNNLFILIGVVYFIYWMSQMNKARKAGEN